MKNVPKVCGTHHMGHIVMDCMRGRPDAVCQIDAATGEQESNASVLSRSVRLARSLRAFGLRPGAVLALGGRNHLDLHIPYYAALFNGLPIVGVDPTFKFDEIKALFNLAKPSVAFCQIENYNDYVEAAKCLGLDTKVVTFDDGDNSMRKFDETYNGGGSIDDFQIANFDTDKIYAWLVSTSGTTGKAKIAAFKHKIWIEKIQTIIHLFRRPEDVNNLTNKPALNLSPVHWVSGIANAIGMPVSHQIKIQTSVPLTTEHVIDIINKYKPVYGLLGPAILSSILNSGMKCDFTCFDSIIITGGVIHKDLNIQMRKMMREGASLVEAYGQTENLGPVLMPNTRGPIGNCGNPSTLFELKLVDPETGKEITEPNVTGELWTKAECFSEYYNDPEETAKAFTEDGWYKTGDLLYRDKDNNYYFVERISMLIKYRNSHVVPPELEGVIRTHPDVLDVSVTSIPHVEDGEWPVACVVRRPGSELTAARVKELVAEKLSANKQLRGGVVFMEELPMTSTGKVARAQLKKIVLDAHRE